MPLAPAQGESYVSEVVVGKRQVLGLTATRSQSPFSTTAGDVAGDRVRCQSPGTGRVLCVGGLVCSSIRLHLVLTFLAMEVETISDRHFLWQGGRALQNVCVQVHGSPGAM